MARKFRLTIECEIPNGVSTAEAKDYAITELERGGGNRHPDDPLFGGLKVTRIGTNHESYLLKGYQNAQARSTKDYLGDDDRGAREAHRDGSR